MFLQLLSLLKIYHKKGKVMNAKHLNGEISKHKFLKFSTTIKSHSELKSFAKATAAREENKPRPQTFVHHVAMTVGKIFAREIIFTCFLLDQCFSFIHTFLFRLVYLACTWIEIYYKIYRFSPLRSSLQGTRRACVVFVFESIKLCSLLLDILSIIRSMTCYMCGGEEKGRLGYNS